MRESDSMLVARTVEFGSFVEETSTVLVDDGGKSWFRRITATTPLSEDVPPGRNQDTDCDRVPASTQRATKMIPMTWAVLKCSPSNTTPVIDAIAGCAESIIAA